MQSILHVLCGDSQIPSLEIMIFINAKSLLVVPFCHGSILQGLSTLANVPQVDPHSRAQQYRQLNPFLGWVRVEAPPCYMLSFCFFAQD